MSSKDCIFPDGKITKADQATFLRECDRLFVISQAVRHKTQWADVAARRAYYLLARADRRGFALARELRVVFTLRKLLEKLDGA